MKVRDAMHENAVWIAPDMQLPDIAKIMREQDVGALPVGENDKLIGMVTDRDVVVRGFDEARDPIHLTARDVMSEPILFCSEEADLEQAAHLMEKHKVRRLPVISEARRMVGMLSIGDLAAASSPALCNETMQAVSAHHA
ncbi:CBS domain-containing protein [Pontixanthobacter gangjinensis]|uniref:CBS domain-containing protein n=1 Tax=Pontixanthobacter gangjinensis TaxID=1028742 RepID=A0A6I4SNP9_9SPHN|nr:CBS domain-containing protein [Pontixanthobacter gangjinensis]MXO57259.1 CBS domain-containing protein [Pontixanthobacter gangjinensis]